MTSTYEVVVDDNTITSAWGNKIGRHIVNSFATAAARTSALTGVEEESMITYLEDTDTLWYYNGTVWIPLTERPVYKSAQQDVISSTAFVNITDLGVAILDDFKYAFRAVIFYSAGVTGDLKLGYTAPSGATVIHAPMSIGSASASGDWRSSHFTDLSSPGVAGGQTAGVRVTSIIEGSIDNTSGANGTFQLQYAQNSSEAVNTRIYAGSTLHVQRCQ